MGFEKYEKDKDTFIKGGYKEVLRFIEEVKNTERENELLEKKINEFENEEEIIRDQINSIINTYGSETNYLHVSDYYLRIEGTKAVKLNLYYNDMVQGILKYEKVTEHIPESNDNYRKEKMISFHNWEFYEDKDPNWEIPKDIKKLPELYSKMQKIIEYIQILKNKFVKLPELKKGSFLYDMYMVAYNEYLIENDLEDLVEGYWCIPYENIEDFIKKLHLSE